MTDLAKQAEFFRTPRWAIDSILDKEILTHRVIDPCCGDGVLSESLLARGYAVDSYNKYDWGYGSTGVDYLNDGWNCWGDIEGNTVVMNPPFSLATQFVEKSLERGARKILCFQRTNWRESLRRKEFWGTSGPNRFYICGQRATCWLGTMTEEETKGRSSPTAHGWFVWERGHPEGCLMGDIWK